MSGSVGGYKVCGDCRRGQPLECFSPSKKNRDGRVSYCRECLAARNRLYRRNRAAAQGHLVRERPSLSDGERWCPECRRAKPLTDFPRNRSTRSGYGVYCKPCHNEIGRRNRERAGGSREYHLRRRYGIGQAEVDAMLAEQGGLCAACRTDEPVHVDHDHTTGRVRGMLCFLCNQALGNVRDDVERLQGLIDYLVCTRLAATVTIVEQPSCVIELDGARLHAA